MFAVFAGDTYYPAGGWRDYRGTFETLDAARGGVWECISDGQCDWAHIVDLAVSEIISSWPAAD